MTFTRFKRDNPCPICKSSDGRCRETEDNAVLCMDETTDTKFPGYRFSGLTQNHAWGIWVIDDGKWTEAEREEWKEQQRIKREQRAEEEAKRRAAAMPAIERDRHYRRLLAQLTLHPDDRADLHRRGVTDEQIQRWGVKSVEQWQRLTVELPYTLPGVNLDGSSLNVSGTGYLCPIFDVDGLLAGFQIRLRESESGRYRWLTGRTKKRPNGPSPNLPNGELPIAVHRPQQVTRKAIALAEGTGAKPFLTAQRLEVVTIGAAGGQFASSPETLRYTLDRLSEELDTKRVEFFADAGSPQNKNVLRQYRSTWRLLQYWGYSVRVAWWGQGRKEDLDIDELADLQAIEFLTVAQWEGIAAGRGLQRVEEIGNRFLDKLQRILAPKQPKKRSVERFPEEAYQQYVPGKLPRYSAGARLTVEVEPGLREVFYREAIAKGWSHILDASPTGTFKSTTAGNLVPEMFNWQDGDGEEAQASHLFYLDANHRNPSTETIEKNFTDMPVRHSGLAIDPSRKTPLGAAHTRHPKSEDGLERTQGNCKYAHLFVAAKQRGLNWAQDEAELNPICQKCEFAETCGKPESISLPNQGYRAERRQALQQPRIRLSPESTPVGFEKRINIWEEASALIRPEEVSAANQTDVAVQWTALEKADAELFNRLAPLRRKLHNLLDSKERYGLDLAAIRKELGQVPSWLDASLIDELEELITPSQEEALGASPERVDTSEITGQLQKLRMTLDRRNKRSGKLQLKLQGIKAAIATQEQQLGKNGGFLFADSTAFKKLREPAALRKLRAQAAKVQSEISECTSEVSTLIEQINEAEQERKDCRKAARIIHQSQRGDMEASLLKTPVQWLPDFLRIWIGIRPGAVRIANGQIILTQKNGRHIDQTRGTKNIYLDGTASRDILALHLGIAPESILVCRQKSPAVNNVKRIQVVGFGNAGKLRVESTDRRISAVVEALLQKRVLTRAQAAIIDHRAKKEVIGADLHHFGGRGSNEFRDRKILFIIGLPIENLGAVQDRFATLDNPHISFEQYLNYFIEAELVQEEGRLRANLRPDEDLTVVYIGDHGLPFDNVEVIQAIDVVSEAADRTQAGRRKVLAGVCEIINRGEKLTQAAIAAAAHCTQAWISQFFAKYGGWKQWKKIISDSIEASNRVTYISPEAIEIELPPDILGEELEMAAWLEESAAEAVSEPKAFLSDLGDMKQGYEASTPGFSLDRVFQVLSPHAKQAIAAIFALVSIPSLESELVQAAAST